MVMPHVACPLCQEVMSLAPETVAPDDYQCTNQECLAAHMIEAFALLDPDDAASLAESTAFCARSPAHAAAMDQATFFTKSLRASLAAHPQVAAKMAALLRN